MLSRRIPLLVLALSAPLLLVALVAGGEIAGWAFALLTMMVPGALIAIAAGRRARGAAVAVTLLLAGGAAAMLAFGGSGGAGAGGGLIGGLPVSAWVMLGAFWGWPLILTVWIYTATFEAPEGLPSPEALAGPGAGPRPPGGGAGEPPVPEPGGG